MNSLEWRVACSLAAVYAVRMLGLFMILPVFALQAKHLPGATETLIGIAIGIYGLTQASLQIPLGLVSDRWGRKPIILGGLAIFALGSLVAALADSITGIIIGRFLQGMGAIAAATMALAADLTREEHRTKVMAVIGISIGLSFMLAMVVGPLLNAWAGLSGIFWVTLGLAIVGILLISFAVPTPPRSIAHRDAGIVSDYLGKALGNHSLLRLDAGIFFLHLIMTANFLVLPPLFKNELGITTSEHWKIYLPVFTGSFICAIPLIILAEKRQLIKPLLLLAIISLIVAELMLALAHAYLPLLLLGFLLFFIGFNFLEAVQPSLVAKYVSVDAKGTAMGIYSSSQFLGIFAGGLLGGMIQQQWPINGIFYFSVLMGLLWFLLAYHLPRPQFYSSRIIKLKQSNTDWQDLQQQLLAIHGIYEASIATQEGVAYLKVDKKQLDEHALRAFSQTSA